MDHSKSQHPVAAAGKEKTPCAEKAPCTDKTTCTEHSKGKSVPGQNKK